MEYSTVNATKDFLFARMPAMTGPSNLDKERCIIAFDYTTENFFGDRDSLWIHGWTVNHGATGK